MPDPAVAMAVRAAAEAGEGRSAIATRLGISYAVVSRIIRSTKAPMAGAHVSDDLPRNASTYGNHGCRCADCRSDANRVNNEYKRRAPAPVRRRMYQRTQARFDRVNAEVRAVADAHGKSWTAEEIAVACDRTHTSREAALLIGRSIDTVKKMRRRSNPIHHTVPSEPEGDR